MKGDKYLYSNGMVKGPVTIEKPNSNNYFYIYESNWHRDNETYNSHLASLPSIKVEGNPNWKEGQELILGIDFGFRHNVKTGMAYGQEQYSTILQTTYGTVAVPIQSAQEPEGEETFEDYIRQSRDEFCKFINSLEWNTDLRTHVESLLICFDQMRDRITSQPPKEQGSAPAEKGEDSVSWGNGWDAAMTIANNLCVEISDDYSNDDFTEQADAASSCAKKIRSCIGDRSYFPEPYPPSKPAAKKEEVSHEEYFGENIRRVIDTLKPAEPKINEDILRAELLSHFKAFPNKSYLPEQLASSTADFIMRQYFIPSKKEQEGEGYRKYSAIQLWKILHLICDKGWKIEADGFWSITKRHDIHEIIESITPAPQSQTREAQKEIERLAESVKVKIDVINGLVIGETRGNKEIDVALTLIKKIFDEGLISDDERGKEIWHEYQMILKKITHDTIIPTSGDRLVFYH